MKTLFYVNACFQAMELWMTLTLSSWHLNLILLATATPSQSIKMTDCYQHVPTYILRKGLL
jgi:hypothetical protein